MAIESTYRQYLLGQQLRQSLEEGTIPSYSDLEHLAENLASVTDFSTPQFKADDFAIDTSSAGEVSSASKQNGMLSALYGDISVLLQELERITQQSIDSYERWGTELTSIESSLIDLESRVGDLTLLAQDTEGYVNFVADRFKDLSLVDQDLSCDIAINPALRIVMLKPSSESLLPIALSVNSSTDISFKTVARGGQGVLGSSAGEDLLNAFSDMDTIWQMQVQSTRQEAITGELRIKISDELTRISRIEFTAHTSNTTSPLIVTPLYSVDGYNYLQLPGKIISQSVTDVGVFTFETIEARFFKFILVKPSADGIVGGKYVYEFGARLIQFFDEAFSVTTNTVPRPCLISKPLCVLDHNNNPVEFSRATLETCELAETGTTINYFITVSNDPSVPVDGNTQWHAIDPIGRQQRENPVLVNVGDLTASQFGDNETVIPSYDASGATASGLRNPSSTFHLVGLDLWGDFLDEEKTATVNRYALVNSNERILNYQFKCPKQASVLDDEVEGGSYFLIDPASLILFRNVGEKGLEAFGTTTKVRGVQRGWGFTDPYYTCVAYVQNPDGLFLDTGNEAIWIDEEAKRGQRVHMSAGTHRIKVHKKNWYPVSPGLSTLSSLIDNDPLYPYNHKLLIEGYSYSDDFDEIDECIYRGVDLFAELQMKQVKIFDFINSVASDDYTHFAVDYDLPNSYGNTYGNMLFVIKVNDTLTDFTNEHFVIKFNLVDQKFKYLRLRADLETTNIELTPLLSGYKIKLG